MKVMTWKTILDAEYDFYSSSKGSMSGIPFEHVAHVISVMRGRIEALFAALEAALKVQS